MLEVQADWRDGAQDNYPDLPLLSLLASPPEARLPSRGHRPSRTQSEQRKARRGEEEVVK